MRTMSGAPVPHGRGWIGVVLATAVTGVVLWPGFQYSIWLLAVEAAVIIAMLAGG